MSGAQPQGDIVDFLVHDHDVLKHLVSGLSQLEGDELENQLQELILTLAKHEAAEERAVYPAIRSDTLPGEALATALLAEEAEITQRASDLEKLQLDGGSFPESLDRLQSAILEHLQDEELNLFPLLRNLIGELRRWELGAAYLRAGAAAPTHPHPRVPSKGAVAAVTAPLVAIVDKVRDARRAQ